LENDGDFAVIKVIDNGFGIELKNQALIFKKFTQVNDDSFGKPKGSGLGLFICRRIIQRHSGSLTLKSKHGKGAEFRIDLPYIYGG
jgi:signal transduction histidine kinase